MTKIISLISGFIFGLGLTISGMVNPEKVLGFLNIFGAWDPSLIFVMVGAIGVFSPLFFVFKSRSFSISGEAINLSTNTKVDKNLLLGAGIFGIGWGLVGLCPGPAISSLSFLRTEVFVFVIFMFLGFYLGNQIVKKFN